MFSYYPWIKLCYIGFNRGVIFLKIGYARVSTGLQNLDLQEDSLKNLAVKKFLLII